MAKKIKTAIKFFNKGKGQPYFWVEGYNQEEKEFFEGLGFTERKSPAPKAFGGKDTLNFRGSHTFGLWKQEEMDKICQAIYDKFPEIKQIKVYVANPFD